MNLKHKWSMGISIGKVFKAFTILFATCILYISATIPGVEADVVSAPVDNNLSPLSLYQRLSLDKLGLNSSAFKLAVTGWQKLKQKNALTRNIISIVDFTQSSNNKRLYIIDLDKGQLLFNTFVAHGKNTGEEFADKFSNIPESYMSSLGFYTTANTYMGKHGLSLVLKGLENGFNDKAEERAIVLHGADYVQQGFIEQNGRLGRSFGCPAVSNELCTPIINTIKDGTCLFIYYPDKKYLAQSQLAGS
jgi:hypothetical protein